MDIGELINLLINYANKYLELDKHDFIYAYNYIAQKLDISGDYTYKKINVKQDDLYVIIDNLNKYLPATDINEILGYLSLRPSIIINNFNKLYKQDPKVAFDYLYNYQINNNYIKKREINKNIIIKDNKTPYKLVVTINLSKPEKDNKDIAKLINNKEESNYPKCALCLENINYYGNDKIPQRLDLRYVPLKLNNQDWFMQFSPYAYFNQHIIVIKNNHEPMSVNLDNIKCLFDFVSKFKHLFIGTNADKPIVGGSILNHEHFQGGNYVMPIMKAKHKKEIIFNKLDRNIKCYLLNWPCTTFKFIGTNKNKIAEFINDLLVFYRSYSDSDINLIGPSHNTFTIIVRYFNKKYEAYVIPRNNNVSDEYPNGIFHVRDELSFIKSEGIGLIEAMGLFILPPRLKHQLQVIDEYIKNVANRSQIMANKEFLQCFLPMIDYLINNKNKTINDYLIYACKEILKDINVFKYDEDDIHLNKFIEAFNSYIFS